MKLGKQIKVLGTGHDLRRLRLLADSCGMSHGEVIRTMLQGMSAADVLAMAEKLEKGGCDENSRKTR